MRLFLEGSFVDVVVHLAADFVKINLFDEQNDCDN
jgi:hypothetical protein